MPSPSFHEIRFPDGISWNAQGGPGFSTFLREIGSGFERRDSNWDQQRAEYDVSYELRSDDDLHTLLTFFYCRYGMAYGFRFKDWSDFEALGTPFGGNGPTFDGSYGLATDTAITSIVRQGGLATVVVSAATSNVSVGQKVLISGSSDASFNTTVQVLTLVDAKTFTFSSLGLDATASGGLLSGNPYQLGKLYTDVGGSYLRKISKPASDTTPVIYVNGAPSGVSPDNTTGLVTFSPQPAHGAALTADFTFDVPVRFDSDYAQFELRDFNDGTWLGVKLVEIRQ